MSHRNVKNVDKTKENISHEAAFQNHVFPHFHASVIERQRKQPNKLANESQVNIKLSWLFPIPHIKVLITLKLISNFTSVIW